MHQQIYALQHPIYITGISTISALGSHPDDIWTSYLSQRSFLKPKDIDNTPTFVGELSKKDKAEIEALKQSNKLYSELDDSVLFAMYCGRSLISKKPLKTLDFGINVGSSRGATTLFENYHEQYIKTGKTSTLSSPTTTLGNISSWLAQDLQSKGPRFSHSITCSTAFHAILNGVAWLQAYMAEEFIVGGSEAPLTPFTIAQMRAMKIYAEVGLVEDSKYPNQALNLNKSRNAMILGEGAGLISLSKVKSDLNVGQIVGLGYGTEALKHSASISKDASCIQASMAMAIKDMNPEDINVVVCHAPGTVKGDQAEINAIKEVFGEYMPAVTSNKWQIGHTFGASGILSLEMALLMLKHQKFIGVPFIKDQIRPKSIKTILVNAVGFGGNSVSIVVSL